MSLKIEIGGQYRQKTVTKPDPTDPENKRTVDVQETETIRRGEDRVVPKDVAAAGGEKLAAWVKAQEAEYAKTHPPAKTPTPPAVKSARED